MCAKHAPRDLLLILAHPLEIARLIDMTERLQPDENEVESEKFLRKIAEK